MIEPNKYYSLLEVQKFTGIKTRAYISQYIKDGLLMAISVGANEKKRYAIRGDWVIDFKERYKKGLVKGDKYTIRAMKIMLQGACDYCEQKGIKTLKEMHESINKINE